jgi:hypothetical protein
MNQMNQIILPQPVRLPFGARMKLPVSIIAFNEVDKIAETVDSVLRADAIIADHVRNHAMKMRRVCQPSSGPQAEA